MKKYVFIGLVNVMALTFYSCQKTSTDDKATTTTTAGSNDLGLTLNASGKLTLKLDHTFESYPFQLTPYAFITTTNDTIKVSQLTYYISNVTLTNSNGSVLNLNNYNIIDFNNGQANEIALTGIPAGTYTSISYLVGVDSLANSTGLHIGALDPSYGMYWGWNTGYVFFRIKGQSGAAKYSYSFDIGGDNNRMVITHDLKKYKLTTSAAAASVNLDISKVFNGPYVYDIKVDPNEIHSASSPGIMKMKSNIASAFTLTDLK